MIQKVKVTFLLKMVMISLKSEKFLFPSPHCNFPIVHWPFSHHQQGSIDFNTVNIHRTVWVYFLIFPRSRDGILSEMIFKDHIIQYTPCSLGSVLENTALGTVFSDTLPIGNIRNTSSRGNILIAPAMMQKYSMQTFTSRN